MKTIDIVYACDENFLPQTFVSIYSILVSREKKYFIVFHILVPHNVTKVYYDKQWELDNYEIRFREVDDSCFASVKLFITHITKPTYYRLLIPQLFPNIEKCIYIDGDTLCFSDICELYDETIGDNYIGGCLGELLNWGEEQAQKNKERLNIALGDDYINAGVLLMNLPKLRVIENELIDECKNNYLQQDQDVINKCCYGKIKLLHPRYNLYSWTKNMYAKGMTFRYEMELIKDAIERPCILHFANEYTKPWRNNKCLYYDEWWEIAERVLPLEIVNRLKDEMYKIIQESSEDVLMNKISEASKIILFGYQKIGSEFKNAVIERFGIEKIFGISDNDSDKWNKCLDGLYVYEPRALNTFPDDNLVVITSQRYSTEIRKSLIEMGIKENRIAIYKKKKDSYYMSLNEEYR